MLRVLTVSLSLLIGFGVAVSMTSAQTAPPKGNKGFSTTKSQVVDLGPEIEGMAGRQLRMRMLRIGPGGYIGIHSHKDRPAVVYFLQGTDTVSFSDGTSKTFHAGDMSNATKNTTHWHKNLGKDDVILIAVDVFHPKK